jgi:hypothetical protein
VCYHSCPVFIFPLANEGQVEVDRLVVQPAASLDAVHSGESSRVYCFRDFEFWEVAFWIFFYVIPFRVALNFADGLLI